MAGWWLSVGKVAVAVLYSAGCGSCCLLLLLVVVLLLEPGPVVASTKAETGKLGLDVKTRSQSTVEVAMAHLLLLLLVVVEGHPEEGCLFLLILLLLLVEAGLALLVVLSSRDVWGRFILFYCLLLFVVVVFCISCELWDWLDSS